MVSPSYTERLAWHALDLDSSGHVPAAEVPITDSAGNFTATDVEGALAELSAVGGGTDLGWFNVEDYGAVHDGTTDDTPAIQAAIDACDAAGGGTIWFPAGTYLIAGSLQDTGTYNSQLEIPQNASLKLFRFLGAGSISGSSSTLRSNWNGSISGTPAVISAGTHDSVTLNHVFVVFEHIRLETKANPKLTAVDLTKAATLQWNDFAIAPYESYTGSVPTNTNAIGVDCPWGLNDQNTGGSTLWVDGFYTGIRPSEQMIARAIYTSFCARSVEMRGAEGGTAHLAHSCAIERLNIWFCVRGIVFTGDKRTIHVGLMDCEHGDPSPWATVYDVDDASNYGRGLIRWHTTDYTSGAATDDLLLNGATGISFHGPNAKRWRLASIVDIPTGTNPSTNPATGRRLYADSSTGHLTVRKPDGTTADLESGSGFSNPMTTQDDIIVGGASGTATRLAKGTDGQVLTVDPTTHHLVWATPSGGGVSLGSATPLVESGSGSAGVSGNASREDHVHPADGGGGGGAPTTAEYLTTAADGTLSAERVVDLGAYQLLTRRAAANTEDDHFNTSPLNAKWLAYTGLDATLDLTALPGWAKWTVGGAKLQAVSAGDWTIEGEFIMPDLGAASFSYCGLILTSGTTQASATHANWAVGQNNSLQSYRYVFEKFVNGAFSAAYSQWVGAPPALNRFLRINKASTTYTVEYSTEGKSWQRFFQTSSLGFTPTHFGIYSGATGAFANYFLRY